MHLAEESIDYQIKGKPKVYQTSQIGVVQTLISCVIRGRIYYIATVLLSALFIVSNVYPINSLFRSFLGIIPTNSGEDDILGFIFFLLVTFCYYSLGVASLTSFCCLQTIHTKKHQQLCYTETVDNFSLSL